MKEKFIQPPFNLEKEVYSKVKSPKGGQQKKEEKSTSKTESSSLIQNFGKILVYLGAFVFFAYFLAFLFGGSGIDALFDVLGDPQKGEFACLLLLGFVILLTVARIRGVLGWQTIQSFTILAIVLLIIFLLIISVWPNFSPRESLRNIGEGGQEVQKTQRRELTTLEKLRRKAQGYVDDPQKIQEVKFSSYQRKIGPTIYDGTKFHYLSNKAFWVNAESDSPNDKTRYRRAKNEEYWYGIKGVKKGGEKLELMGESGTVVVFWLEH